MQAAEEKTRTIRANQNRHLYSRLRYSVTGSAIVALAIVWFIREETSLSAALAWLAATLLVSGYRLLSARRFRRDTSAHERWRAWRTRFRIGTYAAATLWALAPWLLFPQGAPTHEVLLVLGIAGIGGGAMATLSFDRQALTVFALTLMIGTVSRLLAAHDTLSLQLAFLVTLYFLFLIKGGMDIGASYLELLQLKEDAKEHNLTLLSAAERIARMGYWQWDMTSSTIELSPNLAHMCGHQGRTGTFGDCLRLVHPDDRHRVQGAIQQVVIDETETSVEYRLKREDSDDWVVMNQIITLHTDSNGHKSVLGTVQDISMIKSAEQKIFAMAYYDELTGLANRGHLQQHLAEQIKHTRRTGQGIALLYIDLDNFKTVNDTLGHAQGDRLLTHLASLLRESVREDDFLARLGGDEFCIVMSDIRDRITPARTAKRCLALARRPIELNGKEVTPRMSIGIAVFPQDGEDEDSLLRAADTAMYAAKGDGGHDFAFHDRRLTEEATRRMQLESDIRQAVAHNAFHLVYQPKVSAASGEITGVEALIRWRHPDRGLVSPAEFIDTAERIGLIADIGNWVLETACRQLRDWKAEGLRLQMAINISPSHFGRPDFVDRVIAIHRRMQLGPGDLEIEITESVSRNTQLHIRNCAALHRHGIRIAIDDFGTGYSSLSILQRLQIDTVKIDRSFVNGLPNDKSSLLMVSTIVAMARGLGFDIVAEGVETQAQAECLRDHGAHCLQGYLFGRPMEAAQVAERIRGSASPALPARPATAPILAD